MNFLVYDEQFISFFLLLMIFAILIKTCKIKHMPNYFCKWILMVVISGITLSMYTFMDGNRSKLNLLSFYLFDKCKQ